MKKITTDDLVKYFESIDSSPKDRPEHFDITPQFKRFLTERPEYGNAILDIFSQATLRGVLDSGNMTAGPISVFVTAFQMGREFEISKTEASELDKLFRKRPKKPKRS